EAEPGVTGLELLLPLTLKWAEEAGVPLGQALAKLSTGAAAVLGVPEVTGRLVLDGVADLCVFDPREPWIVGRASLRSQGAHTPSADRELLGRVRATVVGGRIVYQRDRRGGDIEGPGPAGPG